MEAAQLSEPQPAAAERVSPQKGDRLLILAQLLAGVGLVAFGALLAALSKSATHDIGTAVIGVGAALIPAGVAASASARIVQTLPSAIQPNSAAGQTNGVGLTPASGPAPAVAVTPASSQFGDQGQKTMP